MHMELIFNRLFIVCIALFAAVSGLGPSCCGHRAGIGTAPYDGTIDPDSRINLPPNAICPEEVYCSPGRPAIIVGDGEDDIAIASWQWDVVSTPEGSTAKPIPTDSKNTSLDPDMVGDFILELTVTDTDGLEDSCQTVAHSVVGPPIAFCPDEDIFVEVGTPVPLHGDGYDDNFIVAYRWELVDAPAESTAQILYADQRDAQITPDVAGSYTIRLIVTDDEGYEGSCEFVIRAGGVPTAICPDDMQVPTRTEVMLHGDAEDEGTIVSWHWEVVTHDTDTDPTLGSPNAQDTTFWALRVGHYAMRLTVVDDDGMSDSCDFMITTTPTGPTAICPQDIQTTPLTVVQMSADGEDDGSITAYQWELVSFPAGSAAAPPAPPDAQVASFMPDIAGEYRIRLTVWDNDNNPDFCEFSVLAVPGEGLRVELFWNPPESPSDHSDVDLHLTHPNANHWFDDWLDCYYSNCDASVAMILEWDVPNDPEDNPRLDLDDVDGYGPENINIDEPVTGHVYRVGVHYFQDHGYGPSEVYVKIYCGTISINPVYEVGPKTLYGPSDPFSNDFWKVAMVTWTGFDCNVTPIDQTVDAQDAANQL